MFECLWILGFAVSSARIESTLGIGSSRSVEELHLKRSLRRDQAFLEFPVLVHLDLKLIKVLLARVPDDAS